MIGCEANRPFHHWEHMGCGVHGCSTDAKSLVLGLVAGCAAKAKSFITGFISSGVDGAGGDIHTRLGQEMI